MTTEASFRDRVELGRQAVSNYRAAHAQLHTQGYYPQIHDDHTPLLRKLEDDLREQGFSSLDDFFTASEELNLKELGFEDRTDFATKATSADWEALELKWR
jgi:hypothetical protein